uniref:Uncharacterized protein n=1 Tax=Calcidiscus leptoporus TaxID=127549 RepID=A0A7S0JFG2_9EUKA
MRRLNAGNSWDGLLILDVRRVISANVVGLAGVPTLNFTSLRSTVADKQLQCSTVPPQVSFSAVVADGGHAAAGRDSRNYPENSLPAPHWQAGLAAEMRACGASG